MDVVYCLFINYCYMQNHDQSYDTVEIYSRVILRNIR